MKTTKSILTAVRQINSCHDAFVDYNRETKEIDVWESVSVNGDIHTPLAGFVNILKYQSWRHGKMTQKDLLEYINNY